MLELSVQNKVGRHTPKVLQCVGVSVNAVAICAAQVCKARDASQAISTDRRDRGSVRPDHSFFPTMLPNHRGHHDAGIACTKMPTTKPARPLPNTNHLFIALHGSCESSPDHGQVRPDCSVASRVFHPISPTICWLSLAAKLAARTPSARVRGLPL